MLPGRATGRMPVERQEGRREKSKGLPPRDDLAMHTSPAVHADSSLSILTPEHGHQALTVAHVSEYLLHAQSFKCMRLFHPSDDPKW